MKIGSVVCRREKKKEYCYSDMSRGPNIARSRPSIGRFLLPEILLKAGSEMGVCKDSPLCCSLCAVCVPYPHFCVVCRAERRNSSVGETRHFGAGRGSRLVCLLHRGAKSEQYHLVNWRVCRIPQLFFLFFSL